MSSGLWRTRFGFYLVAIGSAFGLGNLWRFPFIVAENGGGAFVLLYVMLVFIVGMPLLIAELLLGKGTRSSILVATEILSGQKPHPQIPVRPPNSCSWLERKFLQLSPLIAYGSVVLGIFVLAYFSVISGWVLHFLMQFLFGLWRGFEPHAALVALRDNGWLQIMLTSVHLILVIGIVSKGVEDGIERWVGYMTSLFVLLLAGLAIKSLTLDTTPAALQFFFYPDFSKLSLSSLGYAMGHVLFTLSVGFGIMVTYGSYLQKNTNVPEAGFRVAAVDSFISFFAGLLIFPLVMAGVASSSGPELLFQTVPVLLAKMSGGLIYGVAFFLCLYLAALGASLGLLEAGVANLTATGKISRRMGALWTGSACFVVALIPAMSSSYLSFVGYGKKGVLELMDQFLINWCLPVVALGVSQLVVYRLDEKFKRDEFSRDEGPNSATLYSHWVFTLRWLVPILVLGALGAQLVGLLL